MIQEPARYQQKAANIDFLLCEISCQLRVRLSALWRLRWGSEMAVLSRIVVRLQRRRWNPAREIQAPVCQGSFSLVDGVRVLVSPGVGLLLPKLPVIGAKGVRAGRRVAAWRCGWGDPPERAISQGCASMLLAERRSFRRRLAESCYKEKPAIFVLSQDPLPALWGSLLLGLVLQALPVQGPADTRLQASAGKEAAAQATGRSCSGNTPSETNSQCSAEHSGKRSWD